MLLKGKTREIIDNQDGTFSVPLSQGMVAKIDAEDAELVRGFNWSAGCRRGRCYAERMEVTADGRRSLKMHRQIMGLDGPSVDHADGNGLNNRRSNLRHSTRSQNARNRRKNKEKQGFKGVSRVSKSPYWAAYSEVDGVQNYLGTFETPEIAARAYDLFAIVNHGDFASTNFPRDEYPESIEGEPWRQMTRRASR